VTPNQPKAIPPDLARRSWGSNASRESSGKLIPFAVRELREPEKLQESHIGFWPTNAGVLTVAGVIAPIAEQPDERLQLIAKASFQLSSNSVRPPADRYSVNTTASS
jgi:hypothetical protein